MRPLCYFVPGLSDVSASLMTALLAPALQVLTVMNISPRRRRSARVTKKLPRMLAAMVERPRDNNFSTTGVGYGKRVRQDPPTSEYQQKAQTSTPHQSAFQKSPSSSRTRRNNSSTSSMLSANVRAPCPLAPATYYQEASATRPAPRSKEGHRLEARV